jgi:hypothetical protein
VDRHSQFYRENAQFSRGNRMKNLDRAGFADYNLGYSGESVE